MIIELRAICRGAAASIAMAALIGCSPTAKAPSDEALRETSEQLSPPAKKESGVPNASMVVEQAIEAHGGDAVFSRMRVGRTTSEVSGSCAPWDTCTMVDIYRLPGQLNRTVEGMLGDAPFRMAWIFNGDKGWSQTPDGRVRDNPPMKAIQDVYPLSVFKSLIDARKGDYSLSLIHEDGEVDDGFIRVRIEKDSHWHGDVFFDKDKKLLVRSLKSVPDLKTGELITVDTRYSDFRELEGLVLPMTTTAFRGNEIYLKIAVKDFELLDQIDEGVFSRPVENRTADHKPPSPEDDQ